MQIDRYTHLQFPRNNATVASDDASTGVAARAGLTHPQMPLPAPAQPIRSERGESVVLKVQFPASDVSLTARVDPDFYTDGRKAIAVSGSEGDSESRAADHQRAVDRNVGVFTQITLNKDGVLVAKPQMAAEARQPDFVAMAVSALREFSDEADRQKAQSFDFNAVPAEMPWGRLKGLQQLAAKFNVFA
jgi:hypothetical protein